MRNSQLSTLLLILALLPIGCGDDVVVASDDGNQPTTGAIIVNHLSTAAADIPLVWIEAAKANLQVAYGHTSHGSQLITGARALPLSPTYENYTVNINNESDASDGLKIDDMAFDTHVALDLGNPNFTAWETATRTYLADPAHSGINVVLWSWCGQLSTATTGNIETYLGLMDQLEKDFPGVTFVYMTGHLDTEGELGNLKIRNQQIRDFVSANGKILYDFADIESWDPAGTYYPDATDACLWCADWCSAHGSDCNALPSTCSHSNPFNCQLKAQAFWWLMARIAGWTGEGV
jgi:hypothetical protein